MNNILVVSNNIDSNIDTYFIHKQLFYLTHNNLRYKENNENKIKKYTKIDNNLLYKIINIYNINLLILKEPFTTNIILTKKLFIPTIYFISKFNNHFINSNIYFSDIIFTYSKYYQLYLNKDFFPQKHIQNIYPIFTLENINKHNYINKDKYNILIDLSHNFSNIYFGNFFLNLIDLDNNFYLIIKIKNNSDKLIIETFLEQIHFDKQKFTILEKDVLCDLYITLNLEDSIQKDIIRLQLEGIPIIALENFFNKEYITYGDIIIDYQLEFKNDRWIKLFNFSSLITKINYFYNLSEEIKYKQILLTQSFIIGNLNYQKFIQTLDFYINKIKYIESPSNNILLKDYNKICIIQKKKNLSVDKYCKIYNIDYIHLNYDNKHILEYISNCIFKYNYIFYCCEHLYIMNHHIYLSNFLDTITNKFNKTLIMNKKNNIIDFDTIIIKKINNTPLILEKCIELIDKYENITDNQISQIELLNINIGLIENDRLFNSSLFIDNYYEFGDFILNIPFSLSPFSYQLVERLFLKNNYTLEINKYINKDIILVNNNQCLYQHKLYYYKMFLNYLSLFNNNVYIQDINFSSLLPKILQNKIHNNLGVVYIKKEEYESKENSNNNLNRIYFYIMDKIEFCHQNNFDLIFEENTPFIYILENYKYYFILQSYNLFFNTILEKKLLIEGNIIENSKLNSNDVIIDDTSLITRNTLIILDKKLKNIGYFNFFKKISYFMHSF